MTKLRAEIFVALLMNSDVEMGFVCLQMLVVMAAKIVEMDLMKVDIVLKGRSRKKKMKVKTVYSREGIQLQLASINVVLRNLDVQVMGPALQVLVDAIE